jgi:hypothetical protein
MTSGIKGIWVVSWVFVMLALVAACLYDGSDFVLLQFLPVGAAICTTLVLIVGFGLRSLRITRRLTMLIAFVLTVAVTLFVLHYVTDGDYFLSNPTEDFQRFALNGTHWADEDAKYQYRPSGHPLPASVRILESRTFNNFDGEGAAILFEASKQDMAALISSNDVVPTNDTRDWNRLNRWAGWSLWKTSRVLGPSPSLYIRKGSDGGALETASLAVSQDGSRALFLLVNVN